ARLMPIASSSFFAKESLARGGLASGWGAGVFPFDEEDLREMPISRADLEPHYEAVAERIGVAGERDDLLPFLGGCAAMLPALEIDTNAETVVGRYLRRRRQLNALGFYLGRARLAVCTRRHQERGPHRYHDMDFWADSDRSVYRPRWTLEELQRSPSFRYLDRRYVHGFAEPEAGGVEVTARHADSGAEEVHRAHSLVLAAGTLGSARIVLRSLGRYGTRVPILCNPYSYAPVVNLGMIGREARDRRHSLAQLTAIYQPRGRERGIVQTQFYSYRSLLTFKLLKEVPLPFREGLRVMRLLMPLLGILGINHQDRASPAKYCTLRRSAGDDPDQLEVHYEQSEEEKARQVSDEKEVLRHFRRLGCWPIRLIRLPPGSSIHYAGTLPMRSGGAELTCDAEGRLAGTGAVYVADGSLFPYLPAKGLTFTMMACADRIGTRLAKRLTASSPVLSTPGTRQEQRGTRGPA
ncbi:MAG: GMC family oxidoreductase, partial [Gemmatimonadota bacterium]|nr:GMC family oxidoreductase [Gemmatimonadota bacterium]